MVVKGTLLVYLLRSDKCDINVTSHVIGRIRARTEKF